MKISLHWAQQYSNVELDKIGTEKLVEKIGAQLGAVEEVIEWGPKYDGAVVAKVVACQKHPNADKLSVCLVDDGGVVKQVSRNKDGLVEVVCGAPNVKAGLTVAWLPPGMTVPATLDKDPFVLEARDIRGMVSNGMLASAAELGISDDHGGILEIETKDTGDEVKPGTPFKQLYGLDDVVIDVENKMFTHRPDLFGVLGDAREMAGIQQLAFKSPEWYLNEPKFAAVKGLALEAKIETDLVPRFMVVAMDDVAVKPSAIWLQTILTRVGIRPINNIVDITNFVMHLTGQPMHAYDYDKVVKIGKKSTASLEARLSKKGEKLQLLNGKILTLADDSTILISAHGVPVGIGGVMGGAETEVDETTKRIILEAASFDMYNIRRTSMSYGLFTDAVTRFNKGQSPLQNDRVMAYAIDLVNTHAGGKQASSVCDEQKKLVVPKMVRVTPAFVNERLGLDLSADAMQKLLENVEFSVERPDNNELKITPPFWRTDIEIPEDIVEEVGRLYGFDHLPLELPKRDLTPVQQDELLMFKHRLRTILATGGANEVLTYSFVHGDLLTKVGQDPKKAFKLSNALSPELQYYRLSLTPSLLEKVHMNIKAGFDEFAIFEIGKAHNKEHFDDDKLPKEGQKLALVYAAKLARAGAAYYQARKHADELMDKLGIDVLYRPLSEAPTYQTSMPFEPTRSAEIVARHDGTIVGIIGEYKRSVAKALKLPTYSAGFELSTLKLAAAQRGGNYRPLPRYPKVSQDISLKVPSAKTFGEVYDFVHDNLDWPEQTQGSLEPIDIYQKDKASKHITLRLTIASFEKTLTDQEVTKLLDNVAAKAAKALSAERL